MSLTAPQMVDRAGITYRQLDYWTTHGYLAADEPTPGSGVPRSWPANQLAKATLIKRLIDAKIALPRAVELAELARTRHALNVGQGLTLLISQAEPYVADELLPELVAGGLA